MYKDAVCAKTTQRRRDGDIKEQSIETKLVLFKLGCYKVKILVVIPKVTNKKITKTYTEK